MSDDMQGFHTDLHGKKSEPNTDVSMVDCFLEYSLIHDVHIFHKPDPRSSSLLVTSMITVYLDT